MANHNDMEESRRMWPCIKKFRLIATVQCVSIASAIGFNCLTDYLNGGCNAIIHFMASNILLDKCIRGRMFNCGLSKLALRGASHAPVCNSSLKLNIPN